ncbi:hypothetical protein EVAR_28495_1 [Eumeta japonica]|uniref:Uncharacterized protein n=1 Tax=Eumeta variegata TaxID=151549 RepID=A0A4C1WQ89_EUMVA|nr:hypothetical protein EVAR_28495_1 [Eumeta japonica]
MKQPERRAVGPQCRNRNVRTFSPQEAGGARAGAGRGGAEKFHFVVSKRVKVKTGSSSGDHDTCRGFGHYSRNGLTILVRYQNDKAHRLLSEAQDRTSSKSGQMFMRIAVDSCRKTSWSVDTRTVSSEVGLERVESSAFCSAVGGRPPCLIQRTVASLDTTRNRTLPPSTGPDLGIGDEKISRCRRPRTRRGRYVYVPLFVFSITMERNAQRRASNNISI